MSYCDTCIHHDVCGLECVDDEAMTYCADRMTREEVEKLPSVIPQEPNTGRWIQRKEFFINQNGQFIYTFICSKCMSLSYFRKSNKKAIGANVCPNCGCSMYEPQESEESDADSN